MPNENSMFDYVEKLTATETEMLFKMCLDAMSVEQLERVFDTLQVDQMDTIREIAERTL